MATEERVKDIYDEFVPFYDLSYSDRQPEMAFYTSLLRREDKSVLELGCGTGTIVAAIERTLSERQGSASRAVGVDRSTKMLEWAHTRHPNIEWMHGDMTRPPVQGPFDLVVCAFNTLQMLESDVEVLRTFEATRELLGRNGSFVFDLYNASFSETPSVSAEARLNRVVRSFRDADGHLFEVREDATGGCRRSVGAAGLARRGYVGGNAGRTCAARRAAAPLFGKRHREICCDPRDSESSNATVTCEGRPSTSAAPRSRWSYAAGEPTAGNGRRTPRSPDAQISTTPQASPTST